MGQKEIIELLKKALSNRQSNGDFEAFRVNSLTDVVIEVSTGRNYRLHQNEINYILHTELDSIKEYVNELVPNVK